MLNDATFFFLFLQAWSKHDNYLFKKEDFENAVVIPQHREMGTYIVEEIVTGNIYLRLENDIVTDLTGFILGKIKTKIILSQL